MAVGDIPWMSGLLAVDTAGSLLQQAVQPLPYNNNLTGLQNAAYVTTNSLYGGFPGQPVQPQGFNTQMQGASLIPHNPITGDMVILVFNGTQWVKAGSAEELGAMVAEKLPASGESFSLEDITGAEAFIEEINANRAESHP